MPPRANRKEGPTQENSFTSIHGQRSGFQSCTRLDSQELLAGIRALLRRPVCIEGGMFQSGNLTVDTRTHRVTLGSKEVHLARKEFMVLAYLFRNRGSVVTRDMLLEHVWSREVDPSSNTVTAHIRSLRRKLANAAKPLIRTIAGTGYKIDLAEPAASPSTR